MAATIRCPACGRTYPLKSQAEGKSVRCQECTHQFRVSHIGRYQVLEELGRGAFGVVYRVHDPKMDREAAVKVLHAEVMRQAGSADTLHRFRNEAKLLAQIVHTNILPLYEADQHDGQLYLVTALIRGRRLDELIPEHGFADPRRAIDFVIPLLEALHYVHSSYGICHRDVKPANIMIGEGDCLFLMDFGLAVCQDQDASRITTGGTALGTPSYMPPEQAQGELKKIGPASDQYSAAVVLFHMLTGQLPFRKPMPAILHEIIATPAPRPSSLRKGLGADMDRI
ncbi:MAG TPA: protein kinase, partial [Gemmataceae bacterium]|nr:protein kinase [Gemmataceae bacterium]